MLLTKLSELSDIIFLLISFRVTETFLSIQFFMWQGFKMLLCRHCEIRKDSQNYGQLQKL